MQSARSQVSTKNLPTPPSLWRTIGPSFILLGLALGSGELILWPYLAANYGLGLLWGGLLGITFQYALNTETMRYTLVWGESVFVGFRRLSVLIPLWYIISTYIPWSLPGFSSASSEIVSTLVPAIPETAGAVFFLILTGVILSAGNTLYRTVELFQKTVILLGLPFLLFLAFMLTGQQDWVEVGWGLIGRGDGWWLFPENVALASFLGAFAYSGAGGNLNLAQTYYVKEKGFGMGKYAAKITSLFSGHAKPVEVLGQRFKDTKTNRKLWDKWWRLVNLEHGIVFWGLGFITIIVLSVLAKATVLGRATESGLSFLYLESAVISERMGATFGLFFLFVAAVMLFSTQVGVLESSSRIISENVLLLFYRKGKKFNLSLAFYIALWAQIALGIVIYLSGFQEPRLLLTMGAILNGAAMMVSFPLIYWLNKRRLPAHYQPKLLKSVWMLVAFLFFVFFLYITAKDFQI